MNESRRVGVYRRRSGKSLLALQGDYSLPGSDDVGSNFRRKFGDRLPFSCGFSAFHPRSRTTDEHVQDHQRKHLLLPRISSWSFLYHHCPSYLFQSSRSICLWSLQDLAGFSTIRIVTMTVAQSAFTKADITREHELYRYFQPPNNPATSPEVASRNLSRFAQNTLSANAASSPDTTLTALAQLCALRLNAQRAMIR